MPLISTRQVAPPSMVCSTVPPPPTAQPSDVSKNFTSNKSASVGVASARHVRPPLVVAKTAPPVPTASRVAHQK